MTFLSKQKLNLSSWCSISSLRTDTVSVHCFRAWAHSENCKLERKRDPYPPAERKILERFGTSAISSFMNIWYPESGLFAWGWMIPVVHVISSPTFQPNHTPFTPEHWTALGNERWRSESTWLETFNNLLLWAYGDILIGRVYNLAPGSGIITFSVFIYVHCSAKEALSSIWIFSLQTSARISPHTLSWWDFAPLKVMSMTGGNRNVRRAVHNNFSAWTDLTYNVRTINKCQYAKPWISWELDSGNRHGIYWKSSKHERYSRTVKPFFTSFHSRPLCKEDCTDAHCWE